MQEKKKLRQKAEFIKPYRCRYLVAVLENPKDMQNIGGVIRNANALGVEKVYIIDPDNSLPDEWAEMRLHVVLLKKSASAVKWSFIKKFKTTKECAFHLLKNGYTSIATSPHQKGKKYIRIPDGKYTQKKLAVWFGSESEGLSPEAIELSESCISIPMFGIVESLNLATSSGIILYEITNQRRKYEQGKILAAKAKKGSFKNDSEDSP